MSFGWWNHFIYYILRLNFHGVFNLEQTAYDSEPLTGIPITALKTGVKPSIRRQA